MSSSPHLEVSLCPLEKSISLLMRSSINTISKGAQDQQKQTFLRISDLSNPRVASWLCPIPPPTVWTLETIQRPNPIAQKQVVKQGGCKKGCQTNGPPKSSCNETRTGDPPHLPLQQLPRQLRRLALCLHPPAPEDAH